MTTKTNDLTSSNSLTPEMMAAMCYAPLVGWIAGIVILLIETNKKIKWDAVQGILIMATMWAAGWALSHTYILSVFSPMIWVAGLTLQLFMLVKTYQGEKIRLPILAPLTDKIIAEKL